MPVVLCPLCEVRINGGLIEVTPHVQNQHGIFVTHAHAPGFRCRQPGCQNWFASYKGWQRHIRVDHGGGLEDDLHAAVRLDHDIPDNDGPPNAGGVRLELVNNVEDMDVGEGQAHHDHPVGNLQDNPLPDEDDGDNSPQGSDNGSEDGTSNSESDSNDGNDDGMSSGGSIPSDNDSGSEGSGGEDEVDPDLDMKKPAVDMMVKLRSHSTMTRTEVRLAMDGCDSLLRGYCEKVTEKVNRFLENHNLLDNVDAVHLLESLRFNTPFRGIRSDKGQVSGAREYYNYIDPVTLDLQGRIEPVNIGGGNFRQIPVRENLQYVTPKKFLKLLLSKQNVMDYVNNLEPRNDGLLTSYIDGELFQTHPFFRQYPKALQLVLYYDDFEVVCKTGTKTQIHTLAAFYNCF